MQTKADEVGNHWTDLPGDVLATSTSASKTHLTPAEGPQHSFYRVQLVP